LFVKELKERRESAFLRERLNKKHFDELQ